MVVKKKRGRDVEVQEGWRGHVLPFELVQQELLANDLADIRRMDERSLAIDAELSEALEGLSEDDKAALGGAVSDNGDAFVAGRLKACARELHADGDSEELARIVEKASKLFDEQKRLKRQSKQQAIALEAKTKEVIEGLSDEAVRNLLDAKWNRPIVDGLAALPRASVDALVERVRSLADKYSTTFSQVEKQIHDEERKLCDMLGELTGDEFDMAGIRELRALLGGDGR